MSGDANPQRAQILRQRCNRIFAGKTIHDIVGAIEMLTADAILHLDGMTESQATAAASAIAEDIRSIISERFAAKNGGH